MFREHIHISAVT